MPLYRVLQALSVKDKRVPTGTVTMLHLKASSYPILEAQGAIARVSTPPLAILPGWERRAAVLEKNGITTVEDLLEALDADGGKIAALVGEAPAVVGQWQQQLIRDWLVAPQQPG